MNEKDVKRENEKAGERLKAEGERKHKGNKSRKTRLVK